MCHAPVLVHSDISFDGGLLHVAHYGPGKLKCCTFRRWPAAPLYTLAREFGETVEHWQVYNL